MTALVSGQTFATIRGVTYDPLDEAAAFHIEAASGLVERHCRRSFLAVEDHEISLDGSGGDTLVLPDPPVWDVLSVIVDDEVIDEELWIWDEAAGLLEYKESLSVWTRGRKNIDIVYSHGYYLDEDEGEPVLPAEISFVVCQLAQRGLFLSQTGGTTAGTVTSETIGSYSVTYGTDSSTSSSGEVGLAGLEMSALSPHKLTRIGR